MAGYCGVLSKVLCGSIGDKRRGGTAALTNGSFRATTRIELRGVACSFTASLEIV